MNLIRIVTVCALSATALLASPSATIARSDVFKPSVQDQIKLGEQAAQQLRKQSKIVPATDERAKVLERVAHRILDTFPPNEPWHYSFTIIDAKDVNAFALPGGPMFFYTGLLDKLTTEDELAGVIGHELTHVRRQHWAQAYADSQKRGLLITLGLVLLHANNSMANLAGAVNTLYDLKYSRGDEQQADDGGFNAVVAAGYNPEGMVDLFKLLDKQGGGKTPEFISDHPSDQHRMDHIEQRMKQDEAEGRTFPPQTRLPWAK